MKNQIKALLVDRLKLERDAASIGDDEPLFGPEGLGLDSIDALELVLGIEQEFGDEGTAVAPLAPQRR